MPDQPVPAVDPPPIEDIDLDPILGHGGGVAVPQFAADIEDIDLTPILGKGGGVRIDEAVVPPDHFG